MTGGSSEADDEADVEADDDVEEDDDEDRPWVSARRSRTSSGLVSSRAPSAAWIPASRQGSSRQRAAIAMRRA